jgi:filamentous hemagglutinin family protein
MGPGGRTFSAQAEIDASDGAISGRNLFHSFSRFNLDRNLGETATFSQPPNIRNVIARVTGGSPSRIDGALTIQGTAINFFFINPNGVVIGPNATINVPGSIVISNADYVRLGSGTFHASRPSDTVLTSADPTAFGFLPRANPTGIEIGERGSPMNVAVAVPPQQVLSIVGDRIQVRRADLKIDTPVGQPAAGRINLIAPSSGEVVMDFTDPTPPVVQRPVATDGTSIDIEDALVSAAEGGNLFVRGGSLVLTRSELTTVTQSDGGGPIDAQTTGPMTMTDSRIDSSTLGDGDGGSIRIQSRDFLISGSREGSQGDPSSAAIVANTNSRTVGNAAGTGAGGQIAIVTGSLSVVGGANIAALVGRNGDGGDIRVVASSVLLDSSGSENATGIIARTVKPDLAEGGRGKGGNISLSASSLTILNRAQIASETTTPQNSGDISVTVKSVRIDGTGSGRSDFTGITGRVGRADELGAAGNGGTIRVRADSIVLRNGAAITATTFGRGDGGAVEIRGGDIDISGSEAFDFTGIFARSDFPASSGAGGRGGDVFIDARRLTIDGRNAFIGASSDRGTGRAGSVLARFDGDMVVTNGGQVTVSAAEVDGGLIALSSRTSITLLDDARIAAAAARTGGNVYVSADELVRVDSGQITARAGGDGGQITIDPIFVVLNDSLIDGRSGGLPVQVTIDPNAIFLSSNSPILSDAVTAPDPLDISGQLSDLVTSTVSRNAVLQEACVQRYEGSLSSFVLGTRGGLPEGPMGWFPALGPRSETAAP